MSRRITLSLVLVAAAATGILLLVTGSGERPGRDREVDRPEPAHGAPPVLRGHGEQPDGESEAPAEDAGAEEDTSFSVVILVVDARGRVPLEGAAVTLAREEEPPETRTTGADGEVVFQLSRPGLVLVTTRHEGYVPSKDQAVDFALGETTRWTEELEAGIASFGRVVRAEDGRPVVDATVTATDGGEHAGIWSSGSGAVFGPVRSDAQGRFRFPALPPTEVCTFLVRAPGYALARQGFFPRDAAAPEEAIVIRVVPGGRVSGRVYDPEGRPVADATVQLDLEDDYTARTEADGRYTIDGLVFDHPYGAIASSSAYADSEEAANVVTSPDLPETVVDLTLRLPCRLLVRLVDEDGRAVTEEGELTLGAWPVSGWQATPDAKRPGDWVFDVVDPGEHRLQVEVPGFLRVDRRVRLAETEEETLELVLRRGLALEGVVVDDRGEPVADAYVEAEVEDRSWGDVRATTDEAGRFRIAGLGARPHRLRAGADGHASVVLADLTPPRADLRIALERLARVTFRLRLPPGTKPPDVIWLNHETDDGGSGSGESWMEETYEYALPPGRRRFAVEGSCFASWAADVDLQPGERMDLGTIALEEGVELEIAVRDAKGDPVPGATVVLESVHETWRVFSPPLTDRGGRAVVPHLHPGPHTVGVYADGYEDGQLKIEVPAAGARGTVVLKKDG